MYKYDAELQMWAKWVHDKGVVIGGSSFEYVERQPMRNAPSRTLETEIELAVSKLSSVDELSASVLRSHYVYARRNDTQESLAKSLGIELYTFKKRLRKARTFITNNVFEK